MPCDPVRFLIVDDLEENLSALDGLLRREGLELHLVRSGAEALERMLANDYALALLDVQMPEMDGYELAELMRGTERTRKIPIIFLTATTIDEPRRFRGYEAGAVDFITKPIDPMILRWKTQVFFELGQKANELARQRDEMHGVSESLAAALARLRAHVDNSPLAVVELDHDLVISHWSQGAERMFGRRATDRKGVPVCESGWLDGDCSTRLRDWLSAVADSGEPERSALSLTACHADGRPVSCECYGSVIPAGNRAPQTMTMQILDVTARLRAEDTRSLLLGELNHRVKNTLATVQSIARQTLRNASDPDRFVDTFSGRLQALARAHSLLSTETWSGADLRDLIAEQMQLGTLSEDRVHVTGQPIRLSPANTLRMALTLHELTTNAAKYGALSGSAGRIDLSWTINDNALHVRWAERGGPPVAQPMQPGFGSRLIETNSANDGGSAVADWRPDGVVWQFRLPLTSSARPIEHRVDAAVVPSRPPLSAFLAPERRPQADPGALLAGKRLLVVEDEVLVAMDVVDELERAGATVLGTAQSVSQALELIRQSRPNAVVLDGNLGGESVEAVAEALSARSVPFCFLSGYGREHLPAQFGHVPIVEKPFDPRNLCATLGELLSGCLRGDERETPTLAS
jgi:PAS domain S-box-containing protein